MSAETMVNDGAVEDRADAASAGSVASLHFKVAGAFLVVAALAGMIAAFQVVVPELLGGVGMLSYGRLAPVALDTFVYGWLTIGLLGAVHHILPKLSGRPAGSSGLALIGLGLMTAGVVTGGIAVLAGLSEGRLLLEYPLWADALFVAGVGVGATVAVRTTGGTEGGLAPAQWFLVAAPWWLVMTIVAGNVPGIPGVNSALQTSFFQAGLAGLWLAAVGVGVVYYLVPNLTGRPQRRATRLSLIVFWSLAFSWAWTAPRYNVFGPTPDWLETIGAFFSIGLLVPVLGIMADTAVAMRDRWDRVTDRATVRYLMAGLFFFALGVVQNLLQALRSPSAVVGFTGWVPAYDLVLYYGAFSFFLFGLITYALPEITGSRPTRVTSTVHFGLSAAGVVVGVGALWFAGLQQGLTWIATANTDGVLPHGDQFVNSVQPISGPLLLRAFAVAVFAFAQFLFLRPLFGARGEPIPATADGAAQSEEQIDETDPAVFDPPPPVLMGGLLRGAVGLFAVAALAVWIIPSFEAEHTTGTILGDFSRVYVSDSAEASGRQIYLSEGCWYCHTQAVRPIVTDVGLGPVSQPGDYAHETPALLGVERLGPDLMHIGSRALSAEWLVAHLRDPRSARPWSTMPAYDHLSGEALDDLAAYLTSLD